MEILLLTHMYPYPPDDGGRIVTYNSIKYDAESGNKITLITFNNEVIKTVLDKHAEVHIIVKDTRNNYVKMLSNLFSSMPYNLSKYYDEKVITKIDEIIKSKNIELVYIDHLHMAFYGEYIKNRYLQIPVVLRQHNVESTIMDRFYKTQKNLIVKLYAMYQYRKLYNFESRITSIFDKCFMITEDDVVRMKKMNNCVKAVAIPAGVDIDKYQPINTIHNENSIVFLGSMNWLPNEDAITWFVDKMFNRVLLDVPDTKLYIVGKNPTTRVRKLDNKDNIIVTGFVEDEREYIAKAKVFIVPLRIGGGMRIKILNAMSMGKCVVSTSIGAEGIAFNNWEDIVISDDEEKFAVNTVKMLNDINTRRNIEEAARNTIVQKYSWEIVAKKINSEYAKLVGNKHE